MRIRRNYWFVPALALLGILVAAMHFLSKSKVREEVLVLDPKEPPPALPPSEPVKMEPKASDPTAPKASDATAPKSAPAPAPETAPAPALAQPEPAK